MDTNDTQMFRIVATILLVLGAALLAYSAYQYSTQDAGIGREIAAGSDGFFTGDDGAFKTPLILGLVSLGIGAALLFKRPNTLPKRGHHYTGTPHNVP